MAFERVVARTPPTAEESVVVKVVEQPQRETTVVDETIKKEQNEFFITNTHNCFKDPLPKYTLTHLYTQGKGGAHNTQRERKKNLNPSLGLY